MSEKNVKESVFGDTEKRLDVPVSTEKENSALIDTFVDFLILSRVPMREGMSVYPANFGKVFDDEKLLEKYLLLQNKGFDTSSLLMSESVWPEEVDVSWKSKANDFRDYVLGDSDLLTTETYTFLNSVGLSEGQVKELRGVLNKEKGSLLSQLQPLASKEQEALEMVIESNLWRKEHPKESTKKAEDRESLRFEKDKERDVDIEYIASGGLLEDLYVVYDRNTRKEGRDIVKKRIKEKIPGFVVMSTPKEDKDTNKTWYDIRFDDGQKLIEEIRSFFVSTPGKKLLRSIDKWLFRWSTNGVKELLSKSGIKREDLTSAKMIIESRKSGSGGVN